MSHRVVDLTEEVLAVRRLRAAATLPRFVALCCLIGTVISVGLATSQWVLWSSLAFCAGLFFLLARAIERAAVWAVWLLAAVVGALTLLLMVAGVEELRRISKPDFIGIAGVLAILIPCWILVRLGLKAAWHRRRTIARMTTSPRSEWRWFPRDDRLRTALGMFTASLFIYVAGAVPAALLAITMGGHLLIFGVAYLPVAYFAGRLWNRGRRHLALRLQEIRKLDTRAPVLLLRSFGDDDLPLERRYRMGWFFHAPKEAFTLEDYVVNRIWYLGPVIAIGNPREDLSPLGAAREYLPTDQWRTRISQYLDESVFVVCILGSTPGLSWEYEKIQARGKQDSVLVVFPPKPIEELQRRWGVFRSNLHRAASVDISSDSKLGVPLLALFSSSEAPPLVLWCRYNNETAYAVAFSRLFEWLTLPVTNRDTARSPTITPDPQR
jgi:hypothetical protein